MQRAIKAGVTSSLQVYASAIGACKSPRSADLDAALQVYSDMQRCAFLSQIDACRASAEQHGRDRTLER